MSVMDIVLHYLWKVVLSMKSEISILVYQYKTKLFSVNRNHNFP